MPDMKNKTGNDDNSSEEEIERLARKKQKQSEYMQTKPITVAGKGDGKKDAVPLWLITFTDIMALMLTFFVLLYSMSVPQEDKWKQITDALSSKFNEAYSLPFRAGSQDAIEIDKIDRSRALDLTYLRALVNNLLKSKGITNVTVFRNGNRLVVSLPSELLFNSGQAVINLEGKKTLFTLGGALTRMRNRIEVVGHTDPTPMSAGGEYATNWELSLARSASVASMLREVGYGRPIIVRGLSSGRFDEMSLEASEEDRYALARRVDIVLMEDDGARHKFYTAQ